MLRLAALLVAGSPLALLAQGHYLPCTLPNQRELTIASATAGESTCLAGTTSCQLIVRVTDGCGLPVRGLDVVWSAPGTNATERSTTSASGHAASRNLVGSATAGRFRQVATIAHTGQWVAVTYVQRAAGGAAPQQGAAGAGAGAPADLPRYIEKVDGDGTSCVLRAHDCRFTVRVLHASGQPAGGIRVRWSSADGRGSSRVTLTDHTGRTSTTNIMASSVARTMQQRAVIDGTSRGVVFSYRQVKAPETPQQVADRERARQRASDDAQAMITQMHEQSRIAAGVQAQADARRSPVTTDAPVAGAATVRPDRPGTLPNRPTTKELFDEGEREWRRGNLSEAVRLFRAAGDRGHLPAQVRLGGLYYAGTRAVRRDYVEALRWYRLAAAQRSVFAQLMLGRMYRDGTGVRADRAQAIRWLRAAAAGGSAIAKRELDLLDPPKPKTPKGPKAPPTPAPKRSSACAVMYANGDMQRPNLTITKEDISVWLGPGVEKLQLRHVPSGGIRFLYAGTYKVPPGTYVLGLFGNTFPRAHVSGCVYYY